MSRLPATFQTRHYRIPVCHGANHAQLAARSARDPLKVLMSMPYSAMPGMVCGCGPTPSPVNCQSHQFEKPAGNSAYGSYWLSQSPVRDQIGAIVGTELADGVLDAGRRNRSRLASGQHLELAQEIDRLLDAHLRKPVVLVVQHHQGTVVGPGLVDEPADLRIDIVAGVEMIGAPEQPGPFGQHAAAGVFGDPRSRCASVALWIIPQTPASATMPKSRTSLKWLRSTTRASMA